MKCPACGRNFAAPVAECEGCGLSLSELDRRFGPVPKYSGAITDQAGVLTPRQGRKLERYFHLLEKKFPQVRLAVFAVTLPNRPVREFGFWLMNRCRFSESGMGAEKNFCLLLLINQAVREASLTAGYGLERVLPEEQLLVALDQATPAFASGDFFNGIRECIGTLIPILKQASARSAASGEEEIEDTSAGSTPAQPEKAGP